MGKPNWETQEGKEVYNFSEKYARECVHTTHYWRRKFVGEEYFYVVTVVWRIMLSLTHSSPEILLALRGQGNCRIYELKMKFCMFMNSKVLLIKKFLRHWPGLLGE